MNYSGAERDKPALTTAIIEELSRPGISAEVIPTGGNCWAIGVKIHGGYILMTDGDAALPGEVGDLVYGCPCHGEVDS